MCVLYFFAFLLLGDSRASTKNFTTLVGKGKREKGKVKDSLTWTLNFILISPNQICITQNSHPIHFKLKATSQHLCSV